MSPVGLYGRSLKVVQEIFESVKKEVFLNPEEFISVIDTKRLAWQIQR